MQSFVRSVIVVLIGAAVAPFVQIVGAGGPLRVAAQPRTPDVPFEPSARNVVAEMLAMANVHAGDVVYDLGCGDGRIVIAAVKERGARGVCIDIDPNRIRASQENARRAGVEDRITFRTQDLFEASIGDATVVMLYLWPDVTLALRPKFLRELQPGTRIVSHLYDMNPWKPDEVRTVDVDGHQHLVFSWTVPPANRPPTPSVER